MPSGAFAVVKVKRLLVLHPVALPAAFFGTTYQLYKLAMVNPLALYVAVVTLAVGVAGGVAPVHRYTSYEVAFNASFQVSTAVLDVSSVLPLAGAVFIAQAGTGATAVTNTVLLFTQPVAGPLALRGDTYQL